MYNPAGTDDKHEWIELYNDSDSDITLAGGRNGLKFNDGANHYLEETAARGLMTIAAQEYTILADDADTFLADHPEFAGNVIDTTMDLKNSEPITLKITTSDNSQIISEAIYQGTGGSNEDNKTLEWNGSAFAESPIGGGTPGRANSASTGNAPTEQPEPSAVPSPANQIQNQPEFQYSQNVFINEFLPHPETGEQEWVELLNKGNEEVDLSGWSLGDSGKQRFNIPAKTKIAPGEYLVVAFDKSFLNNAGDKLRLFWPDEQEVHSIAFDDPSQSYACARFDKKWFWTNQPTPAEENQKSIKEAPIIKKEAGPPIETIEESAENEPPATPAVLKISVPAAAQLNQPSIPVVPASSAPAAPSLSASIFHGPENQNKSSWPILAGILMLSGLTALGFIAWRRKNPVDKEKLPF